MKKSKLIALILTFIFILTACGDGGSGSGYLFPTSQILYGSSFFLETGLLFHKNVKHDDVIQSYSKIHYLDFESGKSTVFCTKPGCAHEDTDDTCWGAREEANNYFVADGSFYQLESGINIDTYAEYTEFTKSDINRQNKRIIEKFVAQVHSPIFAHNDIVLMPMLEYAEYGEEVDYFKTESSLYFVAYDLRNEKIIEEIEIMNSYNSYIHIIYGDYENKVYLLAIGEREPIDWGLVTEEEMPQTEELVIYQYTSLDTETLEIKRDESFSSLLGLEIEIERPLFISENILYYETNSILYAYNLDSDENTVIYEGEHYISRIVGDKFLYHVNWEEGEFYIYDPETKESRRAYDANNGAWRISASAGIWHEHGDYLYINAYSEHEPVGEYEAGWPFIIKVHKDDIYKEEYEAEIVS